MSKETIVTTDNPSILIAKKHFENKNVRFRGAWPKWKLDQDVFYITLATLALPQCGEIISWNQILILMFICFHDIFFNFRIIEDILIHFVYMLLPFSSNQSDWFKDSWKIKCEFRKDYSPL